jgi:hypothetical protein
VEFIQDVFGVVLLGSIIFHVSSWVVAYVITRIQAKIEDGMRSEVTQPEYYLLKWESNPRWARLEKIKTRAIFVILATGAFMLIVGFIAYLSDSGGECYTRFEDHCSGFE